MNATTLTKGCIVTDINDENNFHNKQGEVSRIYPNGTVIVRFPVFMIPDHTLFPGEKPKARSMTYRGDEVNDLRMDEDWDQGALAQYEAKKLFPHSCFQIRYDPKPFQEGTVCQLEGCDEVAVGRSMVNYVGTAFTVDLCEKHRKEWHGMCTECFPDLKEEEEDDEEDDGL